MTGRGHPDGAVPDDADAVELIAQIRQLAGPDPVGVRQVVAEVLAALDRASGGTLRDQLPEAIRPDLDPERLSPDLESTVPQRVPDGAADGPEPSVAR